MKITYCSGWSRPSKRTIEYWDEDRARKAYEERKLYAVLVGDPERPHCFIESNMKYVGVEFLDEHVRSNLCYTFQELEPGKLFMTRMVTRQFIQDTDKVYAGTAYYIKPDGRVVAEYERFVNHMKTEREAKVDPAPYWMPYPEFGKYVELVQERPVPSIKVEETN
jgi:hypothetical protein